MIDPDDFPVGCLGMAIVFVIFVYVVIYIVIPVLSLVIAIFVALGATIGGFVSIGNYGKAFSNNVKPERPVL